MDRNRVGAYRAGPDEWTFAVWSPRSKSVDLVLVDSAAQPVKTVALAAKPDGYWEITVKDLLEGSLYFYSLDKGELLPDPASRRQPQGVEGPSALLDHSVFQWQNRQTGIEQRKAVIYEMHVGTFTRQGTFDAAIAELQRLVELGVTCVEVMPLSCTPGSRNWGYDGVFPFGVQESYGGPDGFKRFVDACHGHGLAVVLDVVYNHLGPLGNRLRDFAPYFTRRHRTPWGMALNFSGPYSIGVRNYFLQNARQWFTEYKVDGLRLDAVQTIHDGADRVFLRQLAKDAQQLSVEKGVSLLVISETHENEPKYLLSPEKCGLGHHAVWADDLHHALMARASGQQCGYYGDFGTVQHIAAALTAGFGYQGENARFFKGKRGRTPNGCRPSQMVVYLQNHDQVGNRPRGERIDAVVQSEVRKCLTTCVLLCAFTPMLFMGEEFGDRQPFPFFVDFPDSGLNRAVESGRTRELKAFGWEQAPLPAASEETYLAAKPDPQSRCTSHARVMFAFYKRLLELRAAFSLPDAPMLDGAFPGIVVRQFGDAICYVMQSREEIRWQGFNFSDKHVVLPFDCVPSMLLQQSAGMRLQRSDAGFGTGDMSGNIVLGRKFDTADMQWGGPGSLVPEVLEPSTTITLQPWQAVVADGRVK